MSDATQPLRSIAAELALLFLRELEPRVANDRELLVSTEAVLSFAAIRHADPVQWEYWRAILEKYEKSELIEYMLCQPVQRRPGVAFKGRQIDRDGLGRGA